MMYNYSEYEYEYLIEIKERYHLQNKIENWEHLRSQTSFQS